MSSASFACPKCKKEDTLRRAWLCKCPGGRICPGCHVVFEKKDALPHVMEGCPGEAEEEAVAEPQPDPAPAPTKKKKASRAAGASAKRKAETTQEAAPTQSPPKRTKGRGQGAQKAAPAAASPPKLEKKETQKAAADPIDFVFPDDEQSEEQVAIAAAAAAAGPSVEAVAEEEDIGDEDSGAPVECDIIDLEAVRAQFMALKQKHERQRSADEAESRRIADMLQESRRWLKSEPCLSP